MGVDPLSTTTRTTKKNLLLVSTVAATFKIFDISIDKIPVAGISINFDKGVFSFLIALSLIYFLSCFAFYYYIDVKNIEVTNHQRITNKNYESKIHNYVNDYANETRRKIFKLAPHIGHVVIDIDKLLSNAIKYGFNADMLAQEKQKDASGRLYRIFLKDEHGASLEMKPMGNEEFFAIVSRLIDRRIKECRWRFKLYKISLLPRKIGVRASYLIRNYFLDGMLPISFAVLALLSVYDVIDLRWLRNIAPPLS